MSASRRAVFRADAGPRLGGGHVMRCLTLAAALADQGWEIAFAGVAEAWTTVSALARSNFRPIKLSSVDDADELADAMPDGCDLLVVDHYGLDADFELRCRRWARRIFVIDDLANRHHDCDILLDQTPGRVAGDYLRWAPTARCLMGGNYALLDRSFAELRPTAKQRTRLRRVLISFGYTDTQDLTKMALESLLPVRGKVDVDIVIGRVASDIAQLRELAAELGGELHVGVPIETMARLILGADLAIGTSGSSSLERCVLGLPALMITVAGNQLLMAGNLARMNAATLLGPAAEQSPTAIFVQVQRYRKRPELLQLQSQNALDVCDGQGTRRVAQELSEICNDRYSTH